jgi:hypothetical protein
MNQTKAVALAIIITTLVVGGGVYLWQINQVTQPVMQTVQKVTKPVTTKTPAKEEPANSEPLSYSMTGVSATILKNTAPFGYTADQLKSMAEECGSQYEAGYFDKLVAKFSGANKIVYNFKYQGKSQDAGVYTVTLLPNKPGYTSLDQFKKDFDICTAGGDAYPTMLNSNWLLFVNACGTGFDDGSGLPYGCDKVREIIEPSLKLN